MLKKNRFQRLGRLYIIALSGIAAIIILSQVVIQNFINKQQDDSRVINVAGRQRMLSQKISKLVSQISKRDDYSDVQHKVIELQRALDLWRKSHNGLLYGDEQLGLHGNNSLVIRSMFDRIRIYYQNMVVNAEQVIEVLAQSPVDRTTLERHISALLSNEQEFLEIMDRIVFQYDKEAKDKVRLVGRTELMLLIISLVIILLEILFIFKPLADSVKVTIDELVKSEDDAVRMAAQITRLYNELGRSYQDLEAVNLEPEQSSLFLKMHADGEIIEFSDRFKRLFEFDELNVPINLKKWLGKEGFNKDFINGLFQIVTEGKTWNGELNLTSESGEFRWLEAYIVPVSSNYREKKEFVVIAKDVTEIKEAQRRSREINMEKIEKSVQEQRYRSVLILEGQEEERKRIAREIHDGIGQMLTGLKINLEAIPAQGIMKKKIEDSRSLLKNVIREVRRVSFNLTPSSLIDFGIVPAIKKFCQEVSSLTDSEVVFNNKTKFINRLDKTIETNLYRIIQEAVNNSIKYSGSEKIEVALEHTFSHLKVEIIDQGKGFETAILENEERRGKAGHGMFNMKERAAFINAKFDVTSKVGIGTTVKISLPMD